LLTAVVIFEGIERYRERPEIFSLLFLAFLGFLLSGHATGRLKKRFLFSIPCVLVLWDFLHGAVYGVVYLAFFVAGETIRHFLRRSSQKNRGRTAFEGGGNIPMLWIIAGVSVAAMAGCFIVYTVFLKFISSDNPYSFGYEVNGILLPVKSTRFVAQSGLKGNMYNPGHFGGYLAYYLYPERKIFLYNHHVVFRDFPSIAFNPALLEQYGIDIAVLERSWGDSTFYPAIFTPDRWALVFWDDASLVVVRRNGINEPFLSGKGSGNWFAPVTKFPNGKAPGNRSSGR
jgi:hypothetical protein